MTTGRINQVTTVERRRWTVARGRRRRATTAFNTVWAQKHTETLETPLQLGSTREGKTLLRRRVYFDSRTVVEKFNTKVLKTSKDLHNHLTRWVGREGARFTERARDPRGNPVHRLERSEAPTPENGSV